MFFCEFCKNFKSIFWQNSSGWPLLVLICEILEVFRVFFFVFFFLLFSFSIRVFFHRHWQFTGQLGKGGNYVLFHLTTSTRSRTLRHLFATLHVRWLSRIFNHNACVYQTATRWDLPPYRITIWLIDWLMMQCLLLYLMNWFYVFVTAIWHGKPVDLSSHRLSPLHYKRTD